MIALRLKGLLTVINTLRFRNIIQLFNNRRRAVTSYRHGRIDRMVLTLHIIIKRATRPITRALRQRNRGTNITFNSYTLHIINVFLLSSNNGLTINIARSTPMADQIIRFGNRRTRLLQFSFFRRTLRNFRFSRQRIAMGGRRNVKLSREGNLHRNVPNTRLLILRSRVRVVHHRTVTRNINAITSRCIGTL